MISARNAASNPLWFGTLIVDVSGVRLPGEAKQNNLPPESGQPTDGGGLQTRPNLSDLCNETVS
jgi:hypothetical protein